MPTIHDCHKAGCPAAGKGAIKCAEVKGCPLRDKETKKMKVTVTWVDCETHEYECRDFGMLPSAVLIKISDEEEVIIPLSSAALIKVLHPKQMELVKPPAGFKGR